MAGSRLLHFHPNCGTVSTLPLGLPIASCTIHLSCRVLGEPSGGSTSWWGDMGLGSGMWEASWSQPGRRRRAEGCGARSGGGTEGAACASETSRCQRRAASLIDAHRNRGVQLLLRLTRVATKDVFVLAAVKHILWYHPDRPPSPRSMFPLPPEYHLAHAPLRLQMRSHRGGQRRLAPLVVARRPLEASV